MPGPTLQRPLPGPLVRIGLLLPGRTAQQIGPRPGRVTNRADLSPLKLLGYESESFQVLNLKFPGTKPTMSQKPIASHCEYRVTPLLNHSVHKRGALVRNPWRFWPTGYAQLQLSRSVPVFLLQSVPNRTPVPPQAGIRLVPLVHSSGEEALTLYPFPYV